jgi:aminoglycoside 3-N-acetyltransferase
MGEQKTIENSRRLTTRDSLAADLRALGVDRGMTLLLHSSLSAMGWVCGGVQAVIEAVMDVLGPSGNLVVPAQSGGLSDPAKWKAPPVPQAWWQTIRDTMPAYDPARTPTRNMGAIPELFRTWPGAMRSAHPADSFAASGPNAPTIIEPHALDDPFGEGTPLSRLYDMGASVLLVGVGYDRCTALASGRTPCRTRCAG